LFLQGFLLFKTSIKSILLITFANNLKVF